MTFLRPVFAAEGVSSCAATSAARNGSRVRTAGIVLVRQRPGKGNAIFVTLEDETGVTNVVIWARLFERYRRNIMASRLMLVEGELQRSPEGVIHLMASRVEDRSAELDRLSETHDCEPEQSRAVEDLLSPGISTDWGEARG
jgi:error-prone DNA polymerase